MTFKCSFLRRRLADIALVAVSTAIMLALMELLLRLFYPVDYRQPPQQLTPDAWRRSIHRAGSVPGLLYELAPDVRQESHGALVVTNHYGMRDDDPIEPRPNRLVRIVAIGDSYTFGFRVANDETWPNVLERLLNENAGPGMRFEVLNMGVGGYSTRDEALVLKYKALGWKPDLVIIGYVTNDPEIEPVQPLQSYFMKPAWWQHSHLIRLMAKTTRLFNIARFGGGNFALYFHREGRAPWASVLEAFKDISATSEQAGVPVLLAIFPDPLTNTPVDKEVAKVYQQVANAARARKLNPLILAPVFKANNDASLRVGSWDDHPNAKGHRVAAEAIRDEILAHPSVYLQRAINRGIKIPAK